MRIIRIILWAIPALGLPLLVAEAGIWLLAYKTPTPGLTTEQIVVAIHTFIITVVLVIASATGLYYFWKYTWNRFIEQ